MCHRSTHDIQYSPTHVLNRYVPLEEIVKHFDGHDVATAATEEIKKHEEKGAPTSVAVDHVEQRV
jgi:hypothetical protein